jgi:DNA repair exonuclease SbcCD ATPase subunit
MNDIVTEMPFPKDHNQPPVSIVDELADRYKPLLDQFAEVKAAAETVPETIINDEVQAKVAELIKKLRFVEKTLDGARELEREPHAKKVTEVNGFFKVRIEPLEKLRKMINERSDAYLKQKAAAEARRLQEEEDKRREAARVAMERAQEAERTKNVAAAAVNEFEALSNDAKMARANATSDIEKAQARIATAKAGIAQTKAEIANENAKFAQRVQAGEEVTADEKAQKRTHYEGVLTSAKKELEEAEGELKTAREAAAEAKRKQDQIDEDLRNAKKEVKTALREEKRADRIADVVAGPEAELARTRSEHGAVSTLSRRWVSAIVDRTVLDKDALWPFIHGDALEAALYKWMMAQPQDKRVMAGAAMEEETHGQTR